MCVFFEFFCGFHLFFVLFFLVLFGCLNVDVFVLCFC